MLKLIIIISSLLIISCKPDPNKLIGNWATDSKDEFPDTLKITRYKNEFIASTKYNVRTLKYDSEREMMTIRLSYQVGCIIRSVDYHFKYTSNSNKLYFEKDNTDNNVKTPIQSALYTRVSD